MKQHLDDYLNNEKALVGEPQQQVIQSQAFSVFGAPCCKHRAPKRYVECARVLIVLPRRTARRRGCSKSKVSTSL